MLRITPKYSANNIQDNVPYHSTIKAIIHITTLNQLGLSKFYFIKYNFQSKS